MRLAGAAADGAKEDARHPVDVATDLARAQPGWSRSAPRDGTFHPSIVQPPVRTAGSMPPRFRLKQGGKTPNTVPSQAKATSDPPLEAVKERPEIEAAA